MSEGTNGQPLNGQSPHAARPPSSPFAGLTPAVVMHTIRRSLWWTLPMGLVLAGTAAIGAWKVKTKEYHAQAWLQIYSERPRIAFDMEESKLFIRTQLELIRSPLILRDILAEPEVASMPEILENSNPVNWLEDNVRAGSVGNSELFTISFTTPNRSNAPVIVNAILDSYLKNQPQYTNTRVEETIKLLEAELQFREEEMKRLREVVRDIAAKMTRKDGYLLSDPENPSIVLETYQPLEELNSRLAEIEANRQVLLAQRTTADKLLAESGDRELTEAEIVEAVERDSEIQELRRRLEGVELEQVRLKERGLGKDHPSMEQLLATETRIGVMIQRRREERRQGAVEQHKRRIITEHQRDLESLNGQLTLLDTQQSMLLQNLEEEKDKLKKSGDQSLEYAFARQDLDRAEEVHDQIKSRMLALQTEMRAPRRVREMRRASEDAVTVATDPGKFIVMAAGAGFVVPFVLAIFWENRARHLSFSDQVTRETTLPVLAEVSRMPTRLASGRQRKLGLRRAMFEESIDQLRISLMLTEKAREKRVLSVVSSVSGEGKTSISSQLALSMARNANRPVLLVDGDMRAPSQHTVFDIANEPGLAEVLAGENSWRQSVVEWDDLVHVVPAGRLTQNPNALVSNAGLRDLFDEMKQDYAYVVVDCPPLLAASEAYVLARESDGALLCVMRDVSRTIQVRRAYERLQAMGAETVGLVLSGVPTHDYAYRYGGYSRYYKKYYRPEFAENTTG